MSGRSLIGKRVLQAARGTALRLLLVLGALLILLPFTSRSAHAEPAIEVIEAGWDGAAVFGTWTPVRLKVTGADRDLQAVVDVVVEAQYQPGPVTSVRFPIGAYGQVVPLAAGASREVTLWFPIEAEPHVTARLMVGDRLLAETEVPLQMGRPDWPLAAVLAESPGILRSVGSIEVPYQGLPLSLAVAELTTDSIPQEQGRLGAVSALLVQGSVTATLTDTQRSVIQSWVNSGGHLVIIGGAGAAQSARILPDGALPVTFGATGATSLEPLRAWLPGSTGLPASAPAVRFQPSGGQVLAGSEQEPLVWRMDVGVGSVTVMAFDPSLEPLASWPGTPALLREALSEALPGSVPAGPGMPPRGYAPYLQEPALRLQGMVASLPGDAHPGWPVTSLILAAFALLAGPVLYIVLQRIDRRELVWLAVPVLAVGLSASLYVWGVQKEGRDLLTNVVSYIELDAGDEAPARQSIALAFYGPTHDDLSLQVPAGVSVRASGGQAFMGYGLEPRPSEKPPFQILEGADRQVRFMGGEYSSRVMMLQREMRASPRISADISLEDGLLVGTVRNDSSLPLEDAAVIIGDSVMKLGRLAPGQTAPVRLQPDSAPSTLPMFKGPGQSLSQMLFGEEGSFPGGSQPPLGYPGYYVIPNHPDIQRRAQLVDTMLVEPGYVAGPMFGGSMPLTFLAFTRAPTVDGDLLPGGHPHYQLSLLRQRLELSLKPGPFVMPPGLLPPVMLESSSAFGLSGGGNGNLFWLELRGGSLSYAFRPALPEGARAQALVLTTEQVKEGTGVGLPPPPPGAPPGFIGPNAVASPADAGVFSVYNWQNAAWDALPAGSSQRIEGAAYAGPLGEVRVRVTAGSADVVRVLSPSLTIEGVVEGGRE